MEGVNQVTPKAKRAPRKKPSYETRASHTLTRAEAVELFRLASSHSPAEYLKEFDARLAAPAKKELRFTVTTTLDRDDGKLEAFAIHFVWYSRRFGPVSSPADLPCDDDGEPIDAPAFLSVDTFVEAFCDLLADLGVHREHFVKRFAVLDSSGDLSVNQITGAPVVGRRNVAIKQLLQCCLCGDVIPMDPAGRRQDAITAKVKVNAHALACCAACPVQSRELTVGSTNLRLERSKKTLLLSAAGAILYADFDAATEQTQPDEQPTLHKQPAIAEPKEQSKLHKQPVVYNLDDETSDDDSDSRPLAKAQPPAIKSEHSPKLKPAPQKQAAAAAAAPKQAPAPKPKQAPAPKPAPKPVPELPKVAELPEPPLPEQKEPNAHKRKADQSVDTSASATSASAPIEHPPQKAPRVDGIANAIAALLAVLVDVPESVRDQAVAAVAQNWPR
jgi:hypothetical protein